MNEYMLDWWNKIFLKSSGIHKYISKTVSLLVCSRNNSSDFFSRCRLLFLWINLSCQCKDAASLNHYCCCGLGMGFPSSVFPPKHSKLVCQSLIPLFPSPSSVVGWRGELEAQRWTSPIEIRAIYWKEQWNWKKPPLYNKL